MVAPASSFGAELEKVPLSAASRLNGSVEELPRDANGGSMRVNGAEVRRFLRIPAALRFGERPAGAVRGVRGDDMLARTGVVRREGTVGGGGMDLVVDREKVKGLIGFSNVSLLFFFDGELKTAGSTFSLSKSSNVEASSGRLPGERTLLDEVTLALPIKVDFWAIIPEFVSTKMHVKLIRLQHTILAILRACKVLQTRVVKRCKGHSRHRDVSGHRGYLVYERVYIRVPPSRAAEGFLNPGACGLSKLLVLLRVMKCERIE